MRNKLRNLFLALDKLIQPKPFALFGLDLSYDAFDLLFRLLPISNADMREWIMRDSDFDPLHADPRWQEVRRAAASEMGGHA